MRVLITNDDGINAPGLKVLEGIAAELAGIDGEVWTVGAGVRTIGRRPCGLVYPSDADHRTGADALCCGRLSG